MDGQGNPGGVGDSYHLSLVSLPGLWYKRDALLCT